MSVIEVCSIIWVVVAIVVALIALVFLWLYYRELKFEEYKWVAAYFDKVVNRGDDE